jgi:hypothetical protein
LQTSSINQHSTVSINMRFSNIVASLAIASAAVASP